MAKKSAVFFILMCMASLAYSGPIPPGPSLNTIINSGAPQIGAQFNVASATVRGVLTVGSLAAPAITSPMVTATQFVGGGSLLTNLNASQILTGAIPGPVAWNGTIISPAYGGTGQDWSAIAQGRIPYFSGTGVLGTVPAGAAGQILQSGGSVGSPSFTSAPAILGTNVTGIPPSNLAPGSLSPLVVASSIAANGVVPGTYGGPSLSAQITVGSDGRVKTATQMSYVQDPAIAAHFSALDTSTAALRIDLNSEMARAIARENALGVSTGSIYSTLTAETASRISGDEALGVSTGSIYSTLTAETVSRISGDEALGVSTGAIYSALQSTGAALSAEINRATMQENAIAVSTGANYATITALGVSTGTLKAQADAIAVSTGSIYSALNSTAAALTLETSNRITADGLRVLKSGDTMTGQLTVQSSITATSGFYGDGSHLTGISAGDNLGNHIATMTITAGYGISASTISVSSNVYIVGYSSASAYYGDGSHLTGVATSGGSISTVTIDALPIGSFIQYGSTTPPSSYLYCDGTLYSTTTYSALFAVIGYQYGGSGANFTCDFRGMFARGLDTAKLRDSEYRVLGSTETDTFQGHFHQTGPGNQTPGYGSGPATASTLTENSVSVGGPISDGTNGTPRTGPETRPMNVAVAIMVKYRTALDVVYTTNTVGPLVTSSSTYSGSNTFTATGTGGTVISSATINNLTASSVNIGNRPSGVWPLTRMIFNNTPGNYTWTVPSGVNAFKITCAGGGGGGNSGAQNFYDAGGGGGGWAIRYVYDIAVSSVISYTVGAGGAGGVGPGTGGNTVFGSYCAAGGGAASGGILPGSGGAGYIGDILIVGGTGTPDQGYYGINIIGGAGGASYMSTGGWGTPTIGGNGYLGGGGGGGANGAGGNGGAGVVMIEY